MNAETSLKPDADAKSAPVQIVVFSADAGHARAIAREQDGACAIFDDLAKTAQHLMDIEDERAVLVVDLLGFSGDGLEELAESVAGHVPTVLICEAAQEPHLPEILLDAAFFVIHAPSSKGTVKCIIEAARKKAAQTRAAGAHYLKLLETLKTAETGKFVFRTIQEAETLARFLAYAFPDRAAAAKGLTELMRNAVEHGNLEIGFKEKARLIEDGMLEAEIDRRLADDAYQGRAAEAVLAKKPEGVYVVITDKGPGFAWSDFTKFSPDRAAYKNGRGIQLARLTCFDKLAYNEAGNQVTVFAATNHGPKDLT
ncbi:ATP-binding protein [Hyphococcus luteus]|uniref:Uncharacterized protein n=1 Tax=Hyphococcus luteus TaxID=2058213 RepID=A0A2S7KA71_9PROT|nr:ATP-binding protein [Marinicaulis flavus]PQA89387.1 hypothetical protein CW354_00475 [Marinicaulis flavus]